MATIPASESEIRFPHEGAELRGFLALPERSDGARHPAVILIPDVRGISPLYRGFAARLAECGFATLTLDLYSREGTPVLPDMAAVFRWIDSLPDRRILGDVAAAARHLRARSEVLPDAIGVLGFCLGGQYAVMAACRVDGLRACASFYGMLSHAPRSEHRPESPLDMAGDLRCPLVGFYGADDPLIPREDRLAFESVLAGSRKDFALHVFGGAGHSFLNTTRPEDHRPESARVAWRLAVEFLQSKLRDASDRSDT